MGNICSGNYNISSLMDLEDRNLNKSHIFQSNLHSLTNIVIVGKNYIVLRESERYAEVVPFVLDSRSLHKVLIADTTIEYYDKSSGKICLLIFYRALLVPIIDHNLILLFILS
jgi:hypothetical protein